MQKYLGDCLSLWRNFLDKNLMSAHLADIRLVLTTLSLSEEVLLFVSEQNVLGTKLLMSLPFLSRDVVADVILEYVDFSTLYKYRSMRPDLVARRIGNPYELIDQLLIAIDEDDVDLLRELLQSRRDEESKALRLNLQRIALALVRNMMVTEPHPPRRIASFLLQGPERRRLVSGDYAFVNRWMLDPELAPLLAEALPGSFAVGPEDFISTTASRCDSNLRHEDSATDQLSRYLAQRANPTIFQPWHPSEQWRSGSQPLSERPRLLTQNEVRDTLRLRDQGLNFRLARRDSFHFEEIRSLGGYRTTVAPSPEYDLDSLYVRRLFSTDWYRAWRTAATDPTRYSELRSLLGNSAHDVGRLAVDYSLAFSCYIEEPELFIDVLALEPTQATSIFLMSLLGLRVEYTDYGEVLIRKFTPFSRRTTQRIFSRLKQWADSSSAPQFQPFILLKDEVRQS